MTYSNVSTLYKAAERGGQRGQFAPRPHFWCKIWGKGKGVDVNHPVKKDAAQRGQDGNFNKGTTGCHHMTYMYI